MENFDYIKNYQTITSNNYNFLRKETRNSYNEAVYLTKDAEAFMIFIIADQQLKKEFLNWCMIMYGHNVLTPFSHGIFSDMLIGNLPVCFFQLRMLLESLVKCFYADSKYPRHLLSKQKLEMIEMEIKSKNISEMMKESEKISLIKPKSILKLWKDLSDEWIHPEKIIKNEEILPTPPREYIKKDISDIKKLEYGIIEFNIIFHAIKDIWMGYTN